MDFIAEYRRYATVLYLNVLEEHDKNAKYCRSVMQKIAEMGKLSPEDTERMYEEAVVEVDTALKNFKPKTLIRKNK